MAWSGGYPPARRDKTVVETLHGRPIADPYRWLEDPDSEETKQFVEAQNLCYDQATAHTEGVRGQIQERLTALFDFPKTTCFYREGGRLIFEHNTGLQQQSVVYVQPDLGAEPEVLLDPNGFSEDGTTSLRGRAFSRDGSMMSYGVSVSGSDWSQVKFMSVAEKRQLPDLLENVKFSCQSWWRNDGIFYNSYLKDASPQDGTETESNRNQKLFYHKLGTSQGEDVLVWEDNENPELMASAEVTDDDHYLLLFIRKGCERKNLVWAVDLDTTPLAEVKDKWVRAVDTWGGLFSYVANDGADFLFTTTLSSPKTRLVRIAGFLTGGANDPSMWTDIVPEKPEPLESAAAVAQDFVLLEYMKDVKSSLSLHRLADGAHIRDIDIPVGSVAGWSCKRSLREVFIKFTSFLEPGVVYRLADVSAGEAGALETVKATELAGGLDLTQFETHQVFYDSDNGTKIPMFLVHRKGLQLDGQNPTLLYGYGGFRNSLTPSFSVSRLLWCHHLGGVLAVANVRGGGEYGIAWHDAGRLKNKQNCFTDFKFAARHLVDAGYTTAARIAIQGGSNGGLLVCACANQAPELFRAVISQVGVLDILRFHKFTIGHAWTSDFGDPDKPEDFEVALQYSPLHNVATPPEDGSWQYPRMLLLTADHDDRVSPLHSLKMIAELQYAAGASPGQRNPLLIKVDTKCGHGAGKPTSKVIEEVAHIYAFVADATGAVWR